jgi:hypothetical protein
MTNQGLTNNTFSLVMWPGGPFTRAHEPNIYKETKICRLTGV